ncbi:MAG: heat-shock protein, partial [Rubrivivax sp.]|nr:heat-shock protein [Rubrivivax sp.]
MNPHPERAPQGFVAIDFGTSNSAAALPCPEGSVRLVELEPGFVTMPTAVFYRADTPARQFEAERLYGRAAVAAYVEGIDGRLMRSMKSLLGSSLLDQSTDIGAGR